MTWAALLLVVLAYMAPTAVFAGVREISVVRRMSKSSATTPINQNITATVEIDATDTFNGVTNLYTVMGANGPRSVSLTSKRIVTKFRVIPKVYVPERAQQEVFTQYVQPSNIGANQSQSDTFTDAMGRQLLEDGSAPKPRLPRERRPPVPHYPSMRSFLSDLIAIANPGMRNLLQLELLGSVGDSITCGVQGVGRKLAGVFGIHIDPSVQCNGPYASQQDLHNLSDRLDTTVAAEQGFIANQTTFDGDVTTTLQNEKNTTDFILSFAQHTQDQLNEDQIQNAATAHTLFKFQGQVAENFTFVQGEISNVTKQVTNIALELRQTTLDLQSNEGKILDMLTNVTGQFSRAIGVQNDHINTVSKTSDKRFLQLSDSVSAGFDMTIDSINQSPLKTGNILLHQTRFRAIQEDASMDIFLSDLGAAAPDPSTLTKTTANVICDVISMAYMWTNPVGGTPMMSVTNYTWWCSKAMMASRIEATNWMQIMGKLGPTNCSTVYFGDGRCNGWMEISEQQAVMINTANAPNTTILDRWKTDYSFIPGNFVQGGAGNIVTGSNDGIIIKGSDGFFSTQEAICSRGTRSDFNFYRVKSFRNKWHSRVPYTSDACAGGSIKRMMDPPAQGPFTVMYAMITDMILAYRQTLISVNATTVFGRNAGDMTWNFRTFVRINSGDSSAMDVIVMTFSPKENMVPISKIEKVSTTVELNVQVDGGPVQVYSGVLEADETNDLFVSGTYLAGNVYTGFAGEDFIYDIASSEIVPSIFTRGECGKIVYNGVQDPNQFGIQYWMDSNGILYDHGCGGASLHAMREMIDPDPDNGGRCQLPLNANSNGDLCAQLERYKIEPDSIHEVLNFVHRHSTPTFVIEIPDGDLVAVFQSVCPSVLRLARSDFSVNMRLQNPVNSPNKIRAIQTGGCPQTYPDLDFDPLEFDSFTVNTCTDTPAGQSEVITFYTLASDLSISGVCSSVNASVSPGDAVLQPTPVTAGIVETWRGATVQSNQYMFNSVMDGLKLMQRQLYLSFFKVFTEVGIGVPVTILANVSADIAAQDATIEALRDIANTEAGAQFQYGEFADYQELIANSTARAAQDHAAADSDLANAIASNAATQSSLLKVQADLIAVQASAAQFQNASAALRLLLQQIENEGVPSNPADCNNNFLAAFFCNIDGDIGAAGDLLGKLLDNPFKWLFDGLGGGILQMAIMIAAFGGLGLGLYNTFKGVGSGGGGASGGAGPVVVQQPQMPSSQPIQYQYGYQPYGPPPYQQQQPYYSYPPQQPQQQQQPFAQLAQKAAVIEQALSPMVQKAASVAPIPSDMASRMVAAVMPTPAPAPVPAPSPVSVPMPQMPQAGPMQPIAMGHAGHSTTGIGTPAPASAPEVETLARAPVLRPIAKLAVNQPRVAAAAAKMSLLSQIPEHSE